MAQGMSPALAAKRVLNGIRNDEMDILTHTQNRRAGEAHYEGLLAAYDRQADE